MHQVFPEIKQKLGRAYFPNLRYVAVRLMEKHGIKLSFTIPPTRTLKKQESLDQIFDTIWDYILEKDTRELEDYFS